MKIGLAIRYACLAGGLMVAMAWRPAAAQEEAPFVPEYQRDALSLNGVWQRLAGHADLAVYRDEVADGLEGWTPTQAPGDLAGEMGSAEASKLPCVWVRREFELSDAQVQRDAALRWEGLEFGGTIYINGREAATYPHLGPHAALLPDGLLRAGRNTITIRVTGWAEMQRSESGHVLTPMGVHALNWGGKIPAIRESVRLEFFDRVYIRHVLAIPNLDDDTVTLRAELDAVDDQLPEGLSMTATVAPADDPATSLGEQRVKVSGKQVELAVATPGAKRWSPRSPALHVAEVTVSRGDDLLDRVRFRFGFRTIEVKDGRYLLNGEPIYFRGSNLVNEWRWGGPFEGAAKQYIVDEARRMNLNAFRTHTTPPPADWSNVADEYGTMILAELPIIYNYVNWKFTDEEYRQFHDNALTTVHGYITKLWNHPSIAVWVLTNESRYDTAWETGPYRDFVRRLDPTRPTLRAGEEQVGTVESVDLHMASVVREPREGKLLAEIEQFARDRDPARTLGSTEYMNSERWGPREIRKWLGSKDHPHAAATYAEFMSEYTEQMRRAGYDLILPYMYAGWTELRRTQRGRGLWRDDYPTRVSAVLHSAMAPVLASWDLFSRNFEAGGEQETALVLINETHEAVSATLEIAVTPADPMYAPDEAALDQAVHRETRTLTLPANSRQAVAVQWPVPAEPGGYHLAAVVRRDGDKPVVSQRTIRALAPLSPAERSRVRRGDELVSRFDGVTVVWDAAAAMTGQPGLASELRDKARQGDRIVVLQPVKIVPPGPADWDKQLETKWTWNDLVQLELTEDFGSRAFVHEGAGDHPMLRGVNPEALKRWNGDPADHPTPGLVAYGGIAPGDGVEHTPLLWTGNEDTAVAVSFPVGAGEVIVTTLTLPQRLEGGELAPDPAARRIIANLLNRTP